jgi:hypothetical protein
MPRTEHGKLLLRLVDRHAADGLSPQQALLRAVNRHAANSRETRSARPASNVATDCPGCKYGTAEYHVCQNGHSATAPTTARSQRPAQVETTLLRR